VIEINNSTGVQCQEYQISADDEENMRALDRQVRSWTDKFSKLDEEHHRIKSQKSDQDEWVRKLRKDVECKDFELQSERDKNAVNKAYIDSLKLDIERLTLKVDEKIMRIQVIEYDFIDIENSNKLLTSEKDYLEIQHKKNLALISGLQSTCEGDKGKWEEVESSSERKDKKIKDLERQADDWQKKYNKKCSKLVEAESTLGGKVKKIENLQPEILRSKEVNRTLNYEVTDWKNKFDRKETELENERRDTDRLESKLGGIKDELRTMESQVSKLTDEVGQARKDKREAENERMAGEDQ
jgi:chromosome segregation ATPase